MRSREGRLAAVILACGGAAAAAAAVAAETAAEPRPAPEPAKVAASAIDAETVWRAEREVRADPLWAGDEKKKVLRLKKKAPEDKPPDKDKTGKGARWWTDLFSSLSSGLRVALWLIGAAALIWVLLRLRDWLKGQGGGRALQVAPPTHVGTLDIRPESLPADIGAAARALWRGGEQRAALSLLYRGALSRLVHGHGVPIRSASTERECLVLAAPRVSPSALDYLSRLVSGWQAVAYAQRELPADRFEALCAEFDARMAAGAAADAAGRAATAGTAGGAGTAGTTPGGAT